MTPGVMAEFRTADELLAAVAALRREGYTLLETHAPFPLPGVTPALGLPTSRLPRWVFGGGLLGGLLGYAVQWYADVWDYPLIVGGRPLHSAPAFIPATFEATVLGAALAAFLGLLVALRLPALWHPVFEIPGFDRATADRFWVAIDAADPRFDPGASARSLETLGPLRIVRPAP